VVARFVHNDPKLEPRTFVDLLPPLVVTAVPCLAVGLQPDLGTAIIYALIAISILAMNRVRRRAVLAYAALAASPCRSPGTT
jgi:cell division protein FtsW (lipid II flippase)